MNPRHYVDLKETSRNLQPTYYFMINCLLYSRMETGLVSNQDFYDEDVNVYLAHLLHSFINPEYVELLRSAATSAADTPGVIRCVERSLADPARLSAARRAVAADLFYRPGTATRRAAKELYDLMELDALYCDVMVQRWEKFTGKKAERRNKLGPRSGTRSRKVAT